MKKALVRVNHPSRGRALQADSLNRLGNQLDLLQRERIGGLRKRLGGAAELHRDRADVLRRNGVALLAQGSGDLWCAGPRMDRQAGTLGLDLAGFGCCGHQNMKDRQGVAGFSSACLTG